jgi:hypothetical protein
MGSEAMDDRTRRIRQIAYSLWRKEGYPDGQADRHWSTAEAIVAAEDAELKDVEDEPQDDTPHDYVTPLATLKRAPRP